MGVETLEVIDMCAVQDQHRFRIHVRRADCTIILSEIKTHHDLLFWVVGNTLLIEAPLVLQHLLDVKFHMFAEDLLSLLVILLTTAFVVKA